MIEIDDYDQVILKQALCARAREYGRLYQGLLDSDFTKMAASVEHAYLGMLPTAAKIEVSKDFLDAAFEEARGENRR